MSTTPTPTPTPEPTHAPTPAPEQTPEPAPRAYDVTITRATTYRITAPDPESAVDTVLDGNGEEVDGQTLGHHCEPAPAEPAPSGPTPSEEVPQTAATGSTPGISPRQAGEISTTINLAVTFDTAAEEAYALLCATLDPLVRAGLGEYTTEQYTETTTQGGELHERQGGYEDLAPKALIDVSPAPAPAPAPSISDDGPDDGMRDFTHFELTHSRIFHGRTRHGKRIAYNAWDSLIPDLVESLAALVVCADPQRDRVEIKLARRILQRLDLELLKADTENAR